MNRAHSIVTLSASLCALQLACPDRALAGPEPAEAERLAPGVVEPEAELAPTGPEAPTGANKGPEPPRGRALYGLGIFGVTFGIINVGYGVPLAILGPGDAYFAGYIPIAFGAALITLGSFGIHHGKRRREAWRTGRGPEPPKPRWKPKPRPPHVPWLIVGGATTPLGLATVGLMIPRFTDPVLNTRPFAYWVTAWGAASTLAGVAMLSVGAVKAQRHRRAERGKQARLELVPTGWTGPRSFGFGVAGRF